MVYEPGSRIYYQDPCVKVTDEFVTVARDRVLPVDRITLVEIDHYSYRFYASLISCIASVALVVVNLSWFVLVFCLLAIWVRYEYEHYVALYVRMEDGVKLRLLLMPLSRRDTLYRVADAMSQSLNDYRSSGAAEKLTITETIKLRKFLQCLDDAHLDATPERMSYGPKRKIS